MRKFAYKYNFEKNKSELYELPAGATKYEDEMRKIVPCACCWKPIHYGDSYTSATILDGVGFGYMICGECYEKEWELRKVKEDKNE